MEDKLSMRVSIAEKYYPLKVNRSEEERIRKAANLVNDRLLRYKQAYSLEDSPDFMAMVSLHFATKYLEVEESLNQEPIVEKLEDLNRVLASHLDNLES